MDLPRSRRSSSSSSAPRVSYRSLLLVVIAILLVWLILNIGIWGADDTVVRKPTPYGGEAQSLSLRLASLERMQALHSSKLESHAKAIGGIREAAPPPRDTRPDWEREHAGSSSGGRVGSAHQSSNDRTLGELAALQTTVRNQQRAIDRLQSKLSRIVRAFNGTLILSARQQQPLAIRKGDTSVAFVLAQERVPVHRVTETLALLNTSIQSVVAAMAGAPRNSRTTYMVVAAEEVISSTELGRWLASFTLPFEVQLARYIDDDEDDLLFEVPREFGDINQRSGAFFESLCEYAAKLATGERLVIVPVGAAFVTHPTRPNPIDELVKRIDAGSTFAGGLLVRPARNASLSIEKSQRLPIQSAGYEVAIFPPTTRWDGIMAATASPNIILPAKRLSGLNTTDSRAGTSRPVLSISADTAFAVSTAKFRKLLADSRAPSFGRFARTQYTAPQLAMHDWCLHAYSTSVSGKKKPQQLQLPALVESSVASTPSPLHLDMYLGNVVGGEGVASDVGYLLGRWGDEIAAMRDNSTGIAGLTVMWDTYGGCTGFNIEATNIIVPLERSVNVYAMGDASSFCQGNTKGTDETLSRMRLKTFPERFDVWVSHKPPPSYPTFPYNGLVTVGQKPRYVIGRSLAETSEIPSTWVEKIEMIDELWVPSTFLVNVFTNSGVPANKIKKVPIPIDIHFFDPEAAEPLELPLPPNTTHSASDYFKFISVFKMEDRKGWDILLRAFWEEFGPEEKVILYLRTYLYNTPFFSTVEERIEEVANMMDIPLVRAPVIVLKEEIVARAMPSLYKAADAFVLPSRGEGWGIPYMEAMAMGLPTIGTNWSGNVDFMTADTSYLIEVERMERVSSGEWATPSLTSLKNHMRSVFSNRRAAQQKGQAARRHIVANYSQEKVSAQIVAELQRIASELDSHTDTESK